MGAWKRLKDFVLGKTNTQELIFEVRKVNRRIVREGWIEVNGNRRPMTEEEMDQEEVRLNESMRKLDEEMVDLDRELGDL